jgi:hypothetical protein
VMQLDPALQMRTHCGHTRFASDEACRKSRRSALKAGRKLRFGCCKQNTPISFAAANRSFAVPISAPRASTTACRSLCVCRKGRKVVQRLKSSGRRLHYSEKLTSAPMHHAPDGCRRRNADSLLSPHSCNLDTNERRFFWRRRKGTVPDIAFGCVPMPGCLAGRRVRPIDPD